MNIFPLDIRNPQVRKISSPVYQHLKKFKEDNVGECSVGVVAAVSGGADSLALALASFDVAEKLGLPFKAVIVDHGMRRGSRAEAVGVSEMLSNLSVPSQVASVVWTVTTSGPEATARVVRHEALEEVSVDWALTEGFEKILILYGHTENDQAETVLMRLGRGASVASIAAMREFTPVEDEGGVSICRGRPLLTVGREDTENFCNVYELDWVEDPTNQLDGPWKTADGDPLPRSAVRYNVLPVLSEALGQNVVKGLGRVARIAGVDDDALEYYAGKVMEDPDIVQTGDYLTIVFSEISEYPLAVRLRVWRRVWEVFGDPLNERQLLELDGLAVEPVSSPRHPVGKSIHLPNGVKVTRDREGVAFTVGGEV